MLFKDSKEEGIAKSYYKSGHLQSEESYKNGNLEGMVKKYPKTKLSSTDLKYFWDKEQPILDQKIKQGKILKIKGLYLGMNLDNAYEVIPAQLKTNFSLRKRTSLNIIDSFVSGIFAIEADDHLRVTRIEICGAIVDALFNTAGLPAEDFREKFVESYKIERVELFFEQDGALGCRFISPEGFTLTLTSKKDIILEK